MTGRAHWHYADAAAARAEADVATDGGPSPSVTEQECRVCQSDDPNTVHGDFIMGMCRPCSYLVSGRALDARESVDEAVRHFRPDADREPRTDGGGIPCDFCGRHFEDAGAALVCCSHRFAEPLPASPAVTGPERGDRR